MRPSLRAVPLLAALAASGFAGVPDAAAGEKMVLDDGSELRGDLRPDEDGVLELQTVIGTIAIPEARILQIEFGVRGYPSEALEVVHLDDGSLLFGVLSLNSAGTLPIETTLSTIAVPITHIRTIEFRVPPVAPANADDTLDADWGNFDDSDWDRPSGFASDPEVDLPTLQ